MAGYTRNEDGSVTIPPLPEPSPYYGPEPPPTFPNTGVPLTEQERVVIRHLARLAT